MVTHTSITDFLNLKIKSFYHTHATIARVLEKTRRRK
nr:MAG TPA: hypothetical protein [Caudoviricetes sp.]